MNTDTIRVQLTYPLEQVEKPVLYQLITEYKLIPDIRRASIDPNAGGFIFLELTGEKRNLDDALHFLEREGIEVSAIGLDGSEEWAY